jgi:hypothetical protein
MSSGRAARSPHLTASVLWMKSRRSPTPDGGVPPAPDAAIVVRDAAEPRDTLGIDDAVGAAPDGSGPRDAGASRPPRDSAAPHLDAGEDPDPPAPTPRAPAGGGCGACAAGSTAVSGAPGPLSLAVVVPLALALGARVSGARAWWGRRRTRRRR